MIYGYIDGQRLKISQKTVVEKTVDWLEAVFAFSDDWDGYAKVAHFRQGETVYDIVLDGQGRITKDMHLNLGEGEWDVYLHGNKTEGGHTRRVTTETAVLVVKECGELEGDPLPEIPAGVAEQILAKAQSAEDKAEAVKADADAAEQSAADARLSADAAEAGAEAAAEAASDALGAARIAQGAAQDAQESAAAAEASAGGAVSTAAEAMRKAQSVVDAAERGDFNGKPGSDADVTPENIKRALGYDPADAENVPTKEDLSDFNKTKVGYSEVVNGQLLMYSDSTKEHLLATLDLPSGGVNDVKVNGTSVVTDGVAEFGTGTGLAFSGDKKLSVSSAGQSNITARRSGTYLPASSINLLMTAGLTDDNRLQLTDAQKDTACDTLGATMLLSYGWTLKGVITTDDIIDGVNVDLTGCTELLVKGIGEATGSANFRTDVGVLTATALNATRKAFMGRWIDSYFGIECVFSKYTNTTTPNSMADNSSGYSWVNGKKISQITRVFLDNASNITSANVEIYAR